MDSAADVEGHRGEDGLFYLLDFSRTMPPVRPDPRFFIFLIFIFGICIIIIIIIIILYSKKKHYLNNFISSNRFLNGHLYRLFRPEFVEGYKTALCSDGYSGFIQHDEEV